MGKRTTFVNITPLPPSVTRDVAVAMLHNHDEMIELNPLVIEHHPIKTPRDAPADEFLDCAWQELTDKVHYLPGGIAKGKVTYRACFHDLPNGLQTHIYAPLGLDIREKWTVCGTLPGEPEEPRELGLDTPRQGLYLKEEGDMRCNVLMSGFVRKNLDNSHRVLVERILGKASRVQAIVNQNPSASTPTGPEPGIARSSTFQAGSHMSKSTFAQIPASPSISHSNSVSHPPSVSHSNPVSYPPSISSSNSVSYPANQPQNQSQRFYGQQQDPAQQQHGQQQFQPSQRATTEAPASKTFAAEMEGSTGHYIAGPNGGPSGATSPPRAPLGQANRTFVSELDGSDSFNMNSVSSALSSTGSQSFVSELPSSNTDSPHTHPLPSQNKPQGAYPLPSQNRQDGAYSLPSQNKQEGRRASFDQGDDGAVPEDHVAPLRPRQSPVQASDPRFSVISGISDMQTPRAGQEGFDNRFSVVSAVSPRPEQTSFR